MNRNSIRVRVTLLILAAVAVTAALVGAVCALGCVDGIGLFFIILGLTALLMGIFGAIAYRFMGRVTDPLNGLTEAMEKMISDNYNVSVSCDRDDELGALTGTFMKLIGHLRVVINDLNGRVNRDALTGVRNKGGFDNYVRKLNESIRSAAADSPVAFAAVMFDCNELKEINDAYGHDKGDIYLQKTCQLICRIFAHSPVFRVGGDEFVAILINEDYRRRDERMAQFDAETESINAMGKNPWDRVSIARGVSEYVPGADPDVETVVKRADTLMYEEKRKYKAEHGGR